MGKCVWTTTQHVLFFLPVVYDIWKPKQMNVSANSSTDCVAANQFFFSCTPQAASVTTTPSAVVLTKLCTKPAAAGAEVCVKDVCTTPRDHIASSASRATSPIPTARWIVPMRVYVSRRNERPFGGSFFFAVVHVLSLSLFELFSSRLRLQCRRDSERGAM